MKNLFVPYPISLKAKEYGFDEPCITFWSDNGKSLGFNNKYSSISKGYQQKDLSKWDKKYGYGKPGSFRSALKPELCLAPIYQQLIDWFRKKHNIHISITPIADLVHQNDEFSPNGYFSALLEDVTVGKVFHASNTIALISDKYNYNQALIAGLEKAFELIKK